MATHVRVLAILHIVFGSLGVLIGLGVLLLFGGIAGLVSAPGEPESAFTSITTHAAVPILGLIGGAIFLLLFLASIPGIIAGIGLLQYREWARILTIVLSALELINMPFGTALGIYGLWVLLQNETMQLFRNPPVRQAPVYR